jgi:hypothetical protein
LHEVYIGETALNGYVQSLVLRPWVYLDRLPDLGKRKLAEFLDSYLA